MWLPSFSFFPFLVNPIILELNIANLMNDPIEPLLTILYGVGMRFPLQNQKRNRVYNACPVYNKRIGFAAYLLGM